MPARTQFGADLQCDRLGEFLHSAIADVLNQRAQEWQNEQLVRERRYQAGWLQLAK
jgi:hypothetical protein